MITIELIEQIIDETKLTHRQICDKYGITDEQEFAICLNRYGTTAEQIVDRIKYVTLGMSGKEIYTVINGE
jgi:hypothetical protein